MGAVPSIAYISAWWPNALETLDGRFLYSKTRPQKIFLTPPLNVKK